MCVLPELQAVHWYDTLSSIREQMSKALGVRRCRPVVMRMNGQAKRSLRVAAEASRSQTGGVCGAGSQNAEGVEQQHWA